MCYGDMRPQGSHFYLLSHFIHFACIFMVQNHELIVHTTYWKIVNYLLEEKQNNRIQAVVVKQKFDMLGSANE